jgi:hypothetical protein
MLLQVGVHGAADVASSAHANANMLDIVCLLSFHTLFPSISLCDATLVLLQDAVHGAANAAGAHHARALQLIWTHCAQANANMHDADCLLCSLYSIHALAGSCSWRC